MDDLEFFELVGYGVFAIVSAISAGIIAIINRKKIRSRMDILEYTSQKQKIKNNYTRNLTLSNMIVTKIKKNDKQFNENEFKDWAKETFIELNKAWTNKDMFKVRNRVDYYLLEQYDLMLKTNIEKGCLNKEIESINYIDFNAYSKDNEKEIIDVVLNVILFDYVEEKGSGKIVSGNKNVKERTTYKMKFYRKLGSKTDEKENEYSKCPNCGAELNGSENRCGYCNSIVMNSVKQWILNNIEIY